MGFRLTLVSKDRGSGFSGHTGTSRVRYTLDARALSKISASPATDKDTSTK